MNLPNSEGVMDEVLVDYDVRGQKHFIPPMDRADDAWIRYVRIEGTGYDLQNDEVCEWLSKYGQLLTKLEESKLKFEDEHAESDEDVEAEVGTGKFNIKMRIETHIPQYLPLYGRKVKVHYRGISKQCTNCYEEGHYRSDCQNEKISWIEYTSNFIKSSGFPSYMFGDWAAIAADFESKNPRTQSLESASAAEPDPVTSMPIQTSQDDPTNIQEAPTRRSGRSKKQQRT